MDTYEWYLFGHLAGVFLMLAAAGLSTGAMVAAGKSAAANTVVTLLDLLRFSETVITSLGIVLAVVFGLLLVDEGNFEMGDPWVSTAFTLVIVALAIDHGFLLRRVRNIRDEAAALGSAAVPEGLRARLTDPLTAGAGVLLDVILVVLLWVMIAKPGA